MTDRREASLTSLPYQLLLDTILPHLDVRTLVRLRSVSRAFKDAVDDEVVWRRRITEDFQFPIKSSARMTGWKTLYRGLSNSELYTWGDPVNHRLGREFGSRFNENGEEVNPNGLEKSDLNVITYLQYVPFPLRIQWKNSDLYKGKARIVDGNFNNFERPADFQFGQEIQLKLIQAEGRKTDHSIIPGVPVELHAGGWNFFALTQLGQILAWGSSTVENNSSSTEETFKKPTLLDLDGNRAKTLSVGREHAIAQMEDGTLFEWSKRWDRPAIHYSSSLLSDLSDQFSIHQVEAGWNFTAILANSQASSSATSSSSQSEVLMWETDWTYTLEKERWFESATRENANNTPIEPTWQVAVPVVTLPKPPKPFARIAAGEKFIIALTEDGQVYHLTMPEVRTMGNEENTPQARADRLRKSLRDRYVEWKLLPLFCETIKEAGSSSGVWDLPNLKHLLSSDVRITHISAQFKSFAVYAPEAGKRNGSANINEETGEGLGIVLLGTNENPTKPNIIPELQGIGVIKVVHGDWHSGALTMKGEVKTWGTQSKGALGSWDSVPIPENAQTVFSNPVANRRANTPAFPFGGMLTGVWRRAMIARQRALSQLQEQNETEAAERLQERIRELEQAEESERPQPEEQESIQNEERSSKMVKVEKDRYLIRRLPNQIEKPQTIRFGFPRIGERRSGKVVDGNDEMETKFVFDIAFAGWHSGALAIDRNLIFDN